jgi:hypothetical protein
MVSRRAALRSRLRPSIFATTGRRLDRLLDLPYVRQRRRWPWSASAMCSVHGLPVVQRLPAKVFRHSGRCRWADCRVDGAGREAELVPPLRLRPRRRA